MGVDAMIYVADGDLTPEMAEAVSDARPDYTASGGVYRHEDSDGRSWLVFNTWQRYYGSGYERGDWPTIRAQIDYMRATFQRPVYYHGDSDWYGEHEPLTADDVFRLDLLWRQVGAAYGERMRAALEQMRGQR